MASLFFTFQVLLLGHLLADLLLQPRAFSDWKVRSPRGLAAHGAVHGALILALAGVAAPYYVPAALALGALHALVDRARAGAAARWPERGLPVAVLDQAVHASSLWLVASLHAALGLPVPRPPLPAAWLPHLSLINAYLVVIFGGTVWSYLVAWQLHPYAEVGGIRRIDWWTGGWERGLLLASVHTPYGLGLIPFAFLPRIIGGKRMWAPAEVTKMTAGIFLVLVTAVVWKFF